MKAVNYTGGRGKEEEEEKEEERKQGGKRKRRKTQERRREEAKGKRKKGRFRNEQERRERRERTKESLFFCSLSVSRSVLEVLEQSFPRRSATFQPTAAADAVRLTARSSFEPLRATSLTASLEADPNGLK